jgi:hypothetical protein
MDIETVLAIIDAELEDCQARSDAAFQQQMRARNAVAKDSAITSRNMAQGQANVLRKVRERIVNANAS